jgi:hypothetical protein
MSDKTPLGSAELKALVEELIHLAVSHGQATDSGQPELANRSHDNLVLVAREIKERGPDGQRLLLELTRHSEPWVRQWAATYALSISRGWAESVLRELADEGGFVAVSARTTLRQWEAGNLNL